MTATPVAVRGGVALTPIQRTLYASQQRDPRAPLQNMVLLAHIDGEIDARRLADAFATVVAAGDVLRTHVHTAADGSTTVRLSGDIARSEILEIGRADARGWAQQRAAEPIPLARRAYDSAILVHEDGTASWYLALHHCVTDAYSSSLVFRRTADVYAGRPFEPMAYYAWAAAASSGAAHASAVEHWSRRPPAPRVGQLYERHRGPTATSRRLPIDLGGDLGVALEHLVNGRFRSISVDLAWTTVLLTATAVHLHRVGGTDQFAIGVPVHNRSRPETRELIGPLVEVYPVDIAIEPGDTFADLHRRVGRSLNRTLRHVRPGAAPAGADIEAVVNVTPAAELSEFDGQPATVEWVHAGASDANHLVRVQLSRFGRLELALDVNDAAASAAAAPRARDHLATILRTMAAGPDEPIGGFSLLGPDERRTVARWGEGPPAPEPTHVVDRLRSALAQSDDVALVDGDRRLSGRALWRRVGEVAAVLRARGVRPGGRVAIEMHRSADSVVAILATMVAGGSYVPIDPDQPEARRARLVERAGCAVTLRELPPAPDGASHQAHLAAGGESGPAMPRSFDDEAYLLFTSGSTGEPKGVPITHRGLADYLEFALTSYLEPDERPVVPLFSALTFDLTVTSLYLPLLTGGRLVVVTGDGPSTVGRVAADVELTWCKATPSHLELLVRRLAPGHRLRTVVVGGESFGTPLAERLRRALPAARIFNEYGPTEAVVGCMIHEWDPAGAAGPDVPIGVPAPGVALRVVDQYGIAVPPGAIGELEIAKEGLTPGYLDDGDGDGGAFRVDGGRRWYRSGDLVRLDDDDTLVYLRRLDEQLKVGGIRLDPAEIEAALLEHPAVQRAAVRSWSPRHEAPSHHCIRCGLADNVPGAVFDEAGVCDRCHAYDAVREHAEAWFRTPADLRVLRDEARARRTGAHDCVALVSGGKDSTYALFQLVRAGFDVYALTLDNGFISDEAKANVRRSVATLGIDHEFATAERMDEIFRDSLERHSNVCHGCFKTIYTLGTNRALALGAPLVVTGLSRGQLFETRLIPAQFAEGRFDPDAIDAAVVAARRAYHRVDDAVRRLLDTGVFDDDDVFERVSFVDFYRYVDVELAELLRFLDEEAPWVRPADTGRSTNCRINAAGIHTHLLEQGYHNYAEPYAWDVRLGHKRRDEALAELDDRDDATEVAEMLAAVGYSPQRREVLTAWVEVDGAGSAPSPAELRAHLQARLPAHAVPSAFVVVDELPTTSNGKLDTEALPAPQRTHRSGPAMVISPATPLERAIVELWERRLGVDPISVDDDFFALGGDSLAALEMTLALRDELGIDLPDELAFANASPRALARAVEVHRARTGEDGTAHGEPRPGEGGDPPRLSQGERAMLFEHRRRPGDPRYNQGRRYRIEGEVDVQRLRAALRTVVQRHQPLHWTFETPRRRLPADAAIELEFAGMDGEDELDAATRRLHRRPFDLESGPLLRAGVYATPDSTAIVLVTHHVSTDAASFDRLWAELELVYHGDDPAPPAIGVADHAAWQAERVVDADAQHWATTVGAVPRLALHRPPVAEPDGLRERVAAIGADELRAAPGTPFATVLAALAVVVGRYADADEVTVGALTSTREHPSAEPLVGYFLNTLPLTCTVDPDGTLGDLRAKWADVLAAGLAHRRFPFAEMVAARRRAGGPDPTPQVLVTLQQLDDLAFGRRSATQEILFTGSAVADATIFVQLRAGAVVLAVEHSGAVIGAQSADRLLADLDEALAAVVRRSDDRARSVALPSQAASRLVGPPAPPADHVVVRIERAIAAGGERPAVVCGASTISWERLGRWSAAIAGRLCDAGIEPGDRVVVALPRSVRSVAAVLGVLRAGAAYVPIDPTYPSARNRAIAASAGARAVLTDDDPGGLGLDAEAIAVDDPAGAEDTTGERRPILPPPDLDAPAYVIYTSGSTGEPRGVVVRHRELAVSTAARESVYPAAPGRFLVVSSLAFDSSVAGLFWALTAGGTVVLPTDREVHDVDALVDLFGTASITHTLLVPSLYRGLLLRAPDGAPWPDHVVVAGEACGPDVVALHRDRQPHGRLTNEYGPTEATVWVTCAHLDRPSPEVPLGRPIPAVWTAVVDRRGELSPGGVIGELVIGGATVTRGYDRVESDRFADHSPAGPGRVFRTGDRAAVVDGDLYFHGRADEQLNVGGLRIEPAEIEAVLESADGVVAAIVVARDPGIAAGRRALVAHLEGDVEAIDVDDVRRRVADTLPAASRPGVYELHHRLPRSPNGKLDRSAIAALPVTAGRPPSAPSADAGPAVDRVVGYFREVIGRGDIGPDDDFFDAGGDSLRALELLSHIEQQHGIRPRVSVLFESATARTLTASLGLDSPTPGGGRQAALVLRPGNGAQPPLWLWPGADGVLLILHDLVTHLDPDLRVLGVEYPGTRGERPPSGSVEDLGEYCHRALVDAQPEGPYRMLGYSVGGLVAVDVARRLRAGGHEVEYVGAVESGLAGVADPRGRLAKFAEARRARGTRFAARRTWASVRMLVAETVAGLRLAVEGRAIERFGVRPSDRWLFLRMGRELRAAALRYRPEPVDTEIVVYLGDDPSDHWFEAMHREWGAIAGRGVRIEQVDGSHVDNTMVLEPHVASLATAVQADLRRVRG